MARRAIASKTHPASKFSHFKKMTKVCQLLQSGGLKELISRLRMKLHYQHNKRLSQYQTFLHKTRPTSDELTRQCQTNYQYKPCFGVIVPLYNTKLEYLQDLLESFKAQTYSNYKLFMVDASPAENGKTQLTDFMQREINQDQRISYHILERNAGIAENTNQAIELAMQDASVDYIALCDHDDFIEPNTLFEYAKVLNEQHNVKIIYSDEDVVRFKNDPKAAPIIKPDFDPFLLESCNYINHFFACEKKLLQSIKIKDSLYEQPEYNGAQDYDLYLRLVIKAGQLDHDLKSRVQPEIKNAIYTSSTIYHVPKVLYHWRADEGSTAQDPHNKLYAFDSGKRALESYYGRQQIKNVAVRHTEIFGTYRTQYSLQRRPLVSVIIVGKPDINSNNAYRSIRRDYHDTEFIMVPDSSPAAYNHGVESATGDILLFVSSGLKLVAPGSIAEMVAILERDQVGVVGPQLLLPNGNLQHAGLTIGPNGNIEYLFYGMHPDFTYANRAKCVTNYSAVSAACLMVKKSTYHEVGGFDEELTMSVSGVDFCLKVRALGQLVTYTPHAKFQYCKQCRRINTTSKDVEAQQLRGRWPVICQKGDPYCDWGRIRV